MLGRTLRDPSRTLAPSPGRVEEQSREGTAGPGGATRSWGHPGDPSKLFPRFPQKAAPGRVSVDISWISILITPVGQDDFALCGFSPGLGMFQVISRIPSNSHMGRSHFPAFPGVLVFPELQIHPRKGLRAAVPEKKKKKKKQWSAGNFLLCGFQPVLEIKILLPGPFSKEFHQFPVSHRSTREVLAPSGFSQSKRI